MVKSKTKITSIQYVHDPEAAQKWMELLMELIKEQFINESLHRNKEKDKLQEEDK